ncbi:MAG: hypothetical protein JW754_04440 [Candidatus Aenigmarchaeota archaeon]|nr:hypothetical protein [Candidatus Aenigmarchaeota archaeon]
MSGNKTVSTRYMEREELTVRNLPMNMRHMGEEGVKMVADLLKDHYENHCPAATGECTKGGSNCIYGNCVGNRQVRYLTFDLINTLRNRKEELEKVQI